MLKLQPARIGRYTAARSSAVAEPPMHDIVNRKTAIIKSAAGNVNLKP